MAYTMRAVVATGRGRVEVQQVAIAPLLPGEARTRVKINLVCGTDVHYLYDEEKPKTSPWGHERIGEIVEIADGFPQCDTFGEPLKLGDRVTHIPARCGQCYYCAVLQDDFMCMGPPNRQRPAQPPPRRTYGGMADYEIIPAGAHMFRIPDDMPDEVGAMADPLATGLYAVERAHEPGVPAAWRGLGPGQTVVVQGAGGIGLLTAAAAKLSGAHKVIVVGAPQVRLDVCREFGVDETLSIEDMDAAERLARIQEMTPFGLGPDAVFETAGVPTAFVEALEMVRHSGTVLEVGHFSHRGMASIDPAQICRKNIGILGVFCYARPSDLGKAVRLMAGSAAHVPWSKAVTHRFPLDQSQAALDMAHRQEGLRIAVVP